MEYPHDPVLASEVTEYLVTSPDGIYVDGTVGSGGHSNAIGSVLSGGRLICLDRDPDAVELSRKRLAFLGSIVSVVKANYAYLDKVLSDFGVKSIDGVLLDLGMSSHQLDRSGRGFSFSRNEPLDMRMDPEDNVTARDLVNNLSAEELEDIMKAYGEERRAKTIARAIVRARKNRPLETSSQLADLISSVFPQSQRPKSRHPATRVFQALRIAVNKELQNIETFLDKVPFFIAKGGRLVVVSYHSLEDRFIKQAMFGWENVCTCPPDLPVCACGKIPLFKRLTKKGLKPSKREIERNPRARSAVMRAAERV